MQLEIVSPEATLFSGEVESVTAPGVSGSFQLLNNHAPIVSSLQAGEVVIKGTSIKLETEHKDLFEAVEKGGYALTIKSGTLEMNDNKIIVLAD